MADQRAIVVCSCEDTMPLDSEALRHGCRGGHLVTGRHFCGAERDRFGELVATGAPITMGCTQETALFREIAAQGDSDVTFVNLRENAGWSTDTSRAGPKMAALAAAAAERVPAVSFVTLESEGGTLVYGRDEGAIETAKLLKDHLDITVLITRPDNVAPPRATDFPIVKGTIRSAAGHLGGFEIVTDDYAVPVPSSRGALAFGPARDGARSRCDILLDVSGGPPLFPAADLRDGYVRADPGDPTAVLKAVLRARDLVGTFDKPRYITFSDHLCAHSRSGIVGCRRCLDLCPTGAIAPDDDHVAIDAAICAGCGQCATACPTGAAEYALPPADALMRRMRTLLTVYCEAGGRAPVVLFHDESHGGALIDALARHGEGLPRNVLPFAVNETTQVGLEAVVAAFAYGASAVRFVLHAKPRHDVTGLMNVIALAQPIVAGLGLDGARVATIETDDPFVLGGMLRGIAPGDVVPRPASFQPMGSKRGVLRLALRELHRAAPAPVDVVALPAGAPFGAVEINAAGCTLCLACVSACPTGALSDDPDRPMLRFTEDACVQCGLCKATCPEKVINLIPQIDFRAATATARVLKGEEPFCCVRCGKPFGVKSTIERVMAKLDGKHWMYQNSGRVDVIKMCEGCRVTVVTESRFDPHDAQARPKVRTTEDYLRERETKSPT
jgi:Fe-S-cluster-containing hydrogenase component 2